MANWRIITLDRAIATARDRGFDDPDFKGWEEIQPEQRVAIVRTIIDNQGVAGIVFRRSFASSIWGDAPIRDGGVVVWGGQTKPNDVNGPAEYDEHYEAAYLPVCDYHRRQMVVAHPNLPDQDAWLTYLRENLK